MKPEDYLSGILHQYVIYNAEKRFYKPFSKPIKDGKVVKVEDGKEYVVLPLEELVNLFRKEE